MKLVLGMMLYNSMSVPAFNQVIESAIKEAEPAAAIIVDDGGDRSGAFAASKLKAAGVEVIMTRSNEGTRASAANTIITAFLNGWSRDYALLNLDDDVVLGRGWRDVMLRGLERGWGLRWGIPIDAVNTREAYTRLRGASYKDYMVKMFYVRGGEHDTIHSYQSLQAIREAYGEIPPQLHLHFDAFLLHATRCLDFTVEAIDAPVTHRHEKDKAYAKRESGKWWLSIEAAHKLGLSEGPRTAWEAAASLVKAIIGAPIVTAAYARGGAGWGEAASAAMGRIALRAKLLKLLATHGPTPSICESLVNTRELWWEWNRKFPPLRLPK